MICDLSGYEKLKTFFQFVGFLSCVEEIENVKVFMHSMECKFYVA